MFDYNKTLNTGKVIERGEKLYRLSRLFMFIGACAVALAILMALIGLMIDSKYFYFIFLFSADSSFDFTIPLVIIAYLGIILGLIGIPMYYSSLQIYSLGKIAKNTELK
ncbi:MAG: hypothetical protein J6R29_07580 [Clostridia bacterium]|nr:hypothetical protein [Clostridia bacterium]